ncbi:hypothetical protein T03_15492 [Trichinella britovi]|uniref:Uncharacterized protein n=1 Tax=Trichinella britovi TaxID=45882 RepID=A0A0V1C7U5_TRIBR|nr:hypothetical protein T03_15492 [Trichinella britovi]
MKGVDRRQFQTFCRSVFNTLWFQGSMDEWIIFIFHLSGPALRVICKFLFALRATPGAIEKFRNFRKIA